MIKVCFSNHTGFYLFSQNYILIYLIESSTALLIFNDTLHSNKNWYNICITKQNILKGKITSEVASNLYKLSYL
jgi:hypothetical protein